MATLEASLGPEHPDVAVGLNNLAVSLRIVGRHSEAEEAMQRALRIWEKTLGPEHPESVYGLVNLAKLYLDQGRPEEAEPLLETARRICQTKLSTGHPLLGRVLLIYAEVFKKTKRKAEAKRARRQGQAILQQHNQENLLGRTIDLADIQALR